MLSNQVVELRTLVWPAALVDPWTLELYNCSSIASLGGEYIHIFHELYSRSQPWCRPMMCQLSYRCPVMSCPVSGDVLSGDPPPPPVMSCLWCDVPHSDVVAGVPMSPPLMFGRRPLFLSRLWCPTLIRVPNWLAARRWRSHGGVLYWPDQGLRHRRSFPRANLLWSTRAAIGYYNNYVFEGFVIHADREYYYGGHPMSVSCKLII